MGWNDHDDRLMDIAWQFESQGMEYTKAYERALEIRTDELLSGEILSTDTILQIAWEETE